MYCVNGNSSWYINCRPLFGGCPLLGVSVIGGSTVYSIIVVWLCGKIRQLNTYTNMYIHSFLCVHVVCVCSTMFLHNYATPP